MPTQLSSSSITRTTAEKRAATIQRVTEFYRPGRRDPVVVSRKEKFDALCRLAHGKAWITSVPGSSEVTVEMLPNSAFLDELRGYGFDPVPDGEGERIIPGRIMTPTLSEGSTVPTMVAHAGIVRVARWRFALTGSLFPINLR